MRKTEDMASIHPDRRRAMESQCALRRGWVHAGCPCLYPHQCRLIGSEETAAQRQAGEERRVAEQRKRGDRGT